MEVQEHVNLAGRDQISMPMIEFKRIQIYCEELWIGDF